MFRSSQCLKQSALQFLCLLKVNLQWEVSLIGGSRWSRGPDIRVLWATAFWGTQAGHYSHLSFPSQHLVPSKRLFLFLFLSLALHLQLSGTGSDSDNSNESSFNRQVVANFIELEHILLASVCSSFSLQTGTASQPWNPTSNFSSTKARIQQPLTFETAKRVDLLIHKVWYICLIILVEQ